MVVNDKWRCLLQNQFEHDGVTVEDGHFVVEKNMLLDLRKMRSKDVEHLRDIKQFGLFIHYIFHKTTAKIMKIAQKQAFLGRNRTKRTFVYSDG